MVWKYANPVQIEFGVDSFNKLSDLIGGRNYALVTYGEPFFGELAARLKKTAGAPVLVISDVAPNPDYRLLAEQAARFGYAVRFLPIGPNEPVTGAPTQMGVFRRG